MFNSPGSFCMLVKMIIIKVIISKVCENRCDKAIAKRLQSHVKAVLKLQ